MSAQNFSLDITGSKMPECVKVEDRDGQEVPKSCYKNGTTKEGWTVCPVGSVRAAFVSPSHSHDGLPQDNRLTIDPLLIEPGAVLSWGARSVYADFPDTYKITAQAEGEADVTTLFEGTAEDIFTPHCVSLEKFEGKKTVITFICNSENGYLLAIKDIFVGTPAAPQLTVTDTTVRFHDNFTPFALTGSMLNTGAPVELAEAVITAGDTEATVGLDKLVGTGETYAYEFPTDMVFNEKTDYVINFKTASGAVVATVSGSAMVSNFARTQFIDEGTGTWCNSCPEGILHLQKLNRQYPGQLAIACTHFGTDAQDPFVNSEYTEGLKFYAVPYMMLNRNRETQGSTSRNFDQELWSPVEMGLKVENKDDGVYVSLMSANDVDNSSDRYRLGYVMTCDYYQTEAVAPYYQKNILTLVTSEEYYFLPALIQAHLVKFHHINVAGEGYFDGIAKSIPALINANEPTECTVLQPDVPVDEHISNQKLHVYILDTETGLIKNAATVNLDGSQNGSLSNVVTPETEAVSLTLREGRVTVNGTDKAEISFYSTDGRLLKSVSSVNSTELPAGVNGPVVVRATAAEGTAVTLIQNIR